MIEIVRGDITKLAVDAIVNAASTALRGGGGVDGAIHRAAGPRLLAECRRYPGCPTGEAVLTGGYDLPARHVIHTVGPIWAGGGQGEPRLLERAYRNTFRLARQHGDIRTIAFPAISTGVYGYPRAEAARIALRVMHEHEAHFDRIVACLFDEHSERIYRDQLELLRHADTVLEFPDGPRIDLRRPLVGTDRSALASLGLAEPFAVITAMNPRGARGGLETPGGSPLVSALQPLLRDTPVVGRGAVIHRELAARGHRVRAVVGASPDGRHQEASLAVIIPRDEAIELARVLDQLAIFWFDGTDVWLVPVAPDEPARRLPAE